MFRRFLSAGPVLMAPLTGRPYYPPPPHPWAMPLEVAQYSQTVTKIAGGLRKSGMSADHIWLIREQVMNERNRERQESWACRMRLMEAV